MNAPVINTHQSPRLPRHRGRRKLWTLSITCGAIGATIAAVIIGVALVRNMPAGAFGRLPSISMPVISDNPTLGDFMAAYRENDGDTYQVRGPLPAFLLPATAKAGISSPWFKVYEFSSTADATNYAAATDGTRRGRLVMSGAQSDSEDLQLFRSFR